MKANRKNDRMRVAFALILLLAISVITVFESSYSASNMGIVPDTVEYATAAWRLVNEGRYAITINGVAYPPRYPPGFAVFALAPAYQLFGRSPGNAIFGILAWCLAGVAAAFAIGRRIGGIPSGLMAGTALLLLPDYRHYNQVIMSDGTCAAAIIILLLVYLRLTAAPQNWKVWLSAGLLAGVITSIRPTGLSASLPFLVLALRTRPSKLMLKNGPAFLLPLLFITALQLAYNYDALGSPFRSGYQFWCPVPYDYLNLTFGISYVLSNIEAVWQSGLLFLLTAVGFMLLGMRKIERTNEKEKTALYDSLSFVLLTALPLSLFHLFYRFDDPRFFLPISGPLAAVTGAMVCALLLRFRKPMASLSVVAALCLLLILASMRPATDPTRRRVVDQFDKILPKKALLISHIDPVYLDFFLNREADRVILPLSRYTEYASKISAPSRIPMPDPPPLSERDHRCPGILNGGGIDTIAATASEPAGLDVIDAALATGTPVFLDATHLVPAELPLLKRLQKRYRMEPTDLMAVYRLSQQTYPPR